jgi:molybdate transport system substrate-binding protein
MVRSKATLSAVLVLVAVSCGATGGATSAPADPAANLEGSILISAASSLSDVFGALAKAFEADNPLVDVVLNTGGSSVLRDQILEGAPVDVFAAASGATMSSVVGAGDVAVGPVDFATNRLAIAVPTGNPAGVTGLADFGRGDLVIGLCAEEVPCGAYASEALALAGVDAIVDTYEPNVRALLAKVAIGELDAAVTYATDVASAGQMAEGVVIPDAVNVVATYPIAVLARAPNPTAANGFVDFVLSEAGRSILDDYGFGPP